MLLGSSLQVQHEAGLALVDGWLQLRVPAVSAVLIKRMRQALELMLAETVAGTGGGRKKGAGGLLSRQAQAVTAVLQQLLAAEAK
jgi:ATP-dependent RNA helicase DHX29